MRNPFLKPLLLTFLFVFTTGVFAQNTKHTLHKNDYDQWQSLKAGSISPDGNWVSFVISPVEGNDTLYIKSTKGEELYSFPFGSNLAFSKDSKWASIRIGYSEEETKKKKEKKEPSGTSLNLRI